mmetsp:Transcript_13971/g.20861  ORF Transcript_13971/g.20861 Transcript_13971/m.20861 type:complete len:346 (-) Transcript_13971:405-1442(-)
MFFAKSFISIPALLASALLLLSRSRNVLAVSPVFFTFPRASSKSSFPTGRGLIPFGGPNELFFCALVFEFVPFANPITAFRETSFVISRIGFIAAALHSSFRSLPEYPFVTLAIVGIICLASSVILSFIKNKFNICSRDFMLGSPISNVLGRRLKIAESTSYGRLVAPSTVIGGESFASEVIPSHRVRNSDFMLVVALPSLESLWLRNVSISSIKMTEGANFRANEKVPETNLLLSPNHLSIIALNRTFTNVAPLSLAIAFASIVFPVPGAPNSKIPRGGDTSPLSLKKRSGRTIGKTTRSQSSALISSIPPTSLNATVISVGSITSSAIADSYSFNSKAVTTFL